MVIMDGDAMVGRCGAGAAVPPVDPLRAPGTDSSSYISSAVSSSCSTLHAAKIADSYWLRRRRHSRHLAELACVVCIAPVLPARPLPVVTRSICLPARLRPELWRASRA